MLRLLFGALVLLLNLADNATTYFCLVEPIPGFLVVEANPVARWVFDSMGLLEGLVFEMSVTTFTVGFIVWTSLLSPRLRLVILLILIALPGIAVWNNMRVIEALGIMPSFGI
ncbi:MAG: hypothetical protein HRU00_16685 [Myxococcales bacterium]|nr:hypothetical protein [Myxococcales bacterium]